MDEITVFNTHCCGEIGDVVTGIQDLNFKFKILKFISFDPLYF